jgi:hypothetical protein
MPLDHESEFYDVASAYVFPLLLDSAGAASPTYGAPVHVPGIAAVTVDPQFVSATLKGDNGRILATRSKITGEQVQFTYGKIARDALAVIQGGTVVDKGAARTGWGTKFGSPSKFFGMACLLSDGAIDDGIGGVQHYWYKCTLTAGQRLNAATEKFTQPTGTLLSYSTRSNTAYDQFVELVQTPDNPLLMVTPYSS